MVRSHGLPQAQCGNKKGSFPLPFISQMLDTLAGRSLYYFLNNYLGYNQITIAPKDPEKTTFTYPYGTYAYRRMPFGLCNASDTFQRCMMAIFSDLLERCVKVFMDSFELCLNNLSKVLQRYEETNLILNWEKYHFMVEDGIVLGHMVSTNGLDVGKAKIEVIEKLAPLTSIKEI